MRKNLFDGVLAFSASKNAPGYKLSLVFRNDTDQDQLFIPEILLRDASGLVIQPGDHDAFVAQATSLASINIPAPPPPRQTSPESYSYSGTARTSNGDIQNYSGQITANSGGGGMSNLTDGLARGAALRASIDAKRDRDEGIAMLQWANRSWLRNKYTVPGKSAVSGDLFFPATSVSGLPLTLLVRIGGQEFVFKTTGG